ncbi:MAG: LamG domain-containing protein [Candidatus Marsarchaeota archaeon]|nr:LamG domain-containing protein [Candidatus Marsarchaeota archaeon]
MANRATSKAQSAMEYLMTYGWAILIIAVVLGALFQLGVFNSANLAPRAPPGACQIYRPNGPGSTSIINLEGVCNGQLPQYVASLSGFTTSNIMADAASLPTGSEARTIAAWVYTNVNINNIQSTAVIPVIWGACGTAEYSGLGIWPPSVTYFYGDYDDAASNLGIATQTWTFIAVSYPANGNTLEASLYADGNSQTVALSGGVPLNTPSGTQLSFSLPPCSSGYSFNGMLANIQIYNASLSAPEVNALYLEGIGGAPLKLQNLVGWWPLNGNANDYSGNGNNGVPSSVSYTAQWTSGYTPP